MRRFCCAPYFSTRRSRRRTPSCRSGDESAKKDLLPGIAEGTTKATLALTEDSGRWDAGVVTLDATGGPEWTLDGPQDVRDRRSHVADLMIVVARTSKGLSLFAVEGNAPGLVRTPLATMDQTRKQARLEFSSMPARLIGAEGEAGPAVSRTLDLAAVALAAEQVGGAQRCLDMAVDYAKTQDPVRPADRLVPGDQAQVRRHAPRGRVGEVGRVLRAVGRLQRTQTSFRSWRASPSPTARRRISTLLPRTSRSTAGSGSPGSTTPICTSRGRSPRSCSWATRATTASCSPSASVSDPTRR